MEGTCEQNEYRKNHKTNFMLSCKLPDLKPI